MNRYLKTGIIAAFILAIIFIPYCGFNQYRKLNKPKTVISDNTEQTKVESRSDFVIDSITQENKKLAILNDSILKLKIKYVAGRTRVRDSLIYVSDSTCRKSLNILYSECQKVDSVNNWLISTKNERIINDSIESQEKEKKIIAKQKRINRDSIRIVQLTDTLPKVKRKGFIKGFLYGFGSGSAASKGVDILTKIKP